MVAPGLASGEPSPDAGEETAAAKAAAAVSDCGRDGLPDLVRDLMAKAVVVADANADQQTQHRDGRAEQTQTLLQAAQLHAATADEEEEDSADVQLALMAAEMRVPSETLASALQQGQPLPMGMLPHSTPGRAHSAAVAAHLQQLPTTSFASDSGSWEAASRADSGDSAWESVGPLGGPQGSWEWFGPRSSLGAGGLPSNLRPVDDATIAERRAHGYVSLAPNERLRSAFDSEAPGGSPSYVGAASPDVGAVGAAASSFRRTSEPGLPPAPLPPTARRPSSGLAGAGSDAIRRASFGRAAAAQQTAASPQKEKLPSFEEAACGESSASNES